VLGMAVLFGIVAVATGTVDRQEGRFGSDDREGKAAEWTTIRPGGETGCGLGTPYHFYYRPGTTTSKLVVYFQGGGACWNWVSCSGMFDTSVAEDELGDFRGIFDFGNSANPFRDYGFVFVPYCTGDVHVGDTVMQYGAEARNTTPVHHRGYANASAVLDWIDSNLSGVDKVVVAGASAGSYGALFHAPRVARLFPSAQLIYLGDSGVPLLHEYPRILEQWGATGRILSEWAAEGAPKGVQVTLAEAHRQIMRKKDDALLAQITTDADAVQRAFYIISGSPNAREAALTLLRKVESDIPRFRAFVMDGESHGLMRVDDFYRYEEQGVRLRDWVAALVDGSPPESTYCRGCE